jgi:hypothetical protein
MQHYLITNIDNVTLTGSVPDGFGSTDIHLHASAIVLTRDDRPVRPEAACRIRVFGPDAAWPITQLSATTIDHEISPIPSIVPGAIQISYKLIVDRWNLQLVTETHDGTPPEVTPYPAGTPIGDVWRDLRIKTAEHWSGPNMPLLQWVPAIYARQLTKERS